jgi:hypothetical protein
MTKIVINRCYGGFGLSEKAQQYLGVDDHYAFKDDRSNPKLVECVEELGEEANGDFADLAIVEIPDDVIWEVSEYDGYEHVAEQHRTWY